MQLDVFTQNLTRRPEHTAAWRNPIRAKLCKIFNNETESDIGGTLQLKYLEFTTTRMDEEDTTISTTWSRQKYASNRIVSAYSDIPSHQKENTLAEIFRKAIKYTSTNMQTIAIQQAPTSPFSTDTPTPGRVPDGKPRSPADRRPYQQPAADPDHHRRKTKNEAAMQQVRQNHPNAINKTSMHLQ